MAARWPPLIAGLKIESVSRLSACPGALAQRVESKRADGCVLVVLEPELDGELHPRCNIPKRLERRERGG